MELQRIDKILSSQNIASRRELKQMIQQGRVSVNGQTVKNAREKYDPETVAIAVDGREVCFRRYVYIMMNKPAGVLSASRDFRDKTVVDLLPRELQRKGVFPAGRLDKDTEGFILITDDGGLAHQMLSPKQHVYKLYEAVVDKVLTEEDVTAFRQGITCGELHFLPAEMKITAPHTALVEICEGKFHQVKKMFHAVGAEVLHLRRLRIGNVFLDPALPSGGFRELTNEEIHAILGKLHGI